ncbi:MAG: TonB-dependent receptor domain-containing protein, partial [Allosphingosinicella sp.]
TSSIFANYEEIAAFASATFKFNDRFDVTAGGRYSHNKQDAVTEIIQLGVGAPQSGDSSEGVFTWSVSPRFEFSDHVSTYFRIAKGYRPGGPNFIPPGAGPDFPTEFSSDSLISYELGFRAETADHLLTLDGSVYYLDWDNILITSSAIVNGTPVGVNSNGQRARSIGADLTATLRPTRGLNIVANAALVDAELRDDTVPEDGGLNLTGGLAGDQLPYTPKISANISVDYDWAIGTDAEAFVGGNVRIVGDQVAGFSNAYRAAFGSRIEIDGYETVDLRAGANFGRFTVQAYVRNLFDAYGVVSAGAFPTSVQPALGGTSIPLMTASTIRPRTVGVILGARF